MANAKKSALQLSLEAAAFRQREAITKASAAKDEALKEKNKALEAKEAERLTLFAEINKEKETSLASRMSVKAADDLKKNRVACVQQHDR